LARDTNNDRNQETPRRGADRRGGGSGGDRRAGQWWRQKTRRCYFCTEGVTAIRYRDTDVLRRFLSERGRIRPQRQTGTCSRHQRQLARAIKRARYLALLPFTSHQVRGG